MMIDGNTSDGYHTFNELYEHRHALFIALTKEHPELSWYSKYHADGSEMEGWFIAGMHLKSGDISYHLPNKYLHRMMCEYLVKAPEWDGHTSQDVIERLMAW